MTDRPTLADIQAAIDEHGSKRAAARSLGIAESTLRGVLKRADEEQAQTPPEVVEAPEAAQEAAQATRKPNRAERRAWARRQYRTPAGDETEESLHYRRVRRMTRPFRRAFSNWQPLVMGGGRS